MSTTAPTRGLKVELDRPRYLRYSLRKRRIIREKYGELLSGQIDEDVLLEVLLLGFQDDDPTLTQEQLEDLVDMENLNEVLETMTRALGYKSVQVSVPTDPPQAPEAAKSAENPTAGV